MIDEIVSDLRKEMDGTVDSLERDLQRIRTGRANPDLLSNIIVSYYGTDTALNKIASVSAPDAKAAGATPQAHAPCRP